MWGMGQVICSEKCSGGSIAHSLQFIASPVLNLRCHLILHLRGLRSRSLGILENMGSKVLIGCLNNAEAVADACLKLTQEHVDLVMAGVWGNFAIEDFLAAGEIIYQISKKCNDCEISEYAKAAILASRDYSAVKKAFYESTSGKRLTELGYLEDVDFSLKINSSQNVGLYEKNAITKLRFK